MNWSKRGSKMYKKRQNQDINLSKINKRILCVVKTEIDNSIKKDSFNKYLHLPNSYANWIIV